MTEEFDPYLEHAKPTGAYAESLRKAAERREARLIEKSQTPHSAPMVGTPMEREERAQQQQWSRYQKSITLRKKELLEGPQGEHFQQLLKYLNQMKITDAPELVEAVRNSVWLADTDQKARQDALWLIDTTIIKLREEAGLAPFDDPMIGQEPNAFMLIRKHLTGVGND